MDLETAKVVISGGALGVGVIGGAIGLLNYRRDLRHKQTDWLYQLFEKFYEKPTYKSVRALLDCQPETSAEVSALRDALARGGTSAAEEALVDYLNFFEFIIGLQQRRRMDRSDVDALFDYYLDCLARHDFIRSYVGKNGFEALDRELHRRHRKGR